MKKLMFGALLILLGLPGTALFFFDLVHLVLGAAPVLLILGGGLALYLGYEDLEAEKEMARSGSLSSDAEPQGAGPTPESNLASEIRDPAASTDKAQAPDKADEPAGYVGNTESLVFHSTSCNFAQGKNCTAAFTSTEAALAQGFKPCKVCNP